MTQNNLAAAYEAIECYQSALKIRTSQLLPLNCLTTARNLGNLAFKQGNWQLAIESYDLAIQAVETSRGWANAENRQLTTTTRLDNPLESAIKLADGNITLQRLIKSRYQHLREIFLSCCETNLGNAGITDDLLTLSTGFLCAGASTVISTLWAVDDADLKAEFDRGEVDKRPPAKVRDRFRMLVLSV